MRKIFLWKNLGALTELKIGPNWGTKKKLHIDNNKSVDDILNSDEWKDFWDLLKNNPQNAPDRCKQMCSGPINENVEMDLYEAY